MARKEQSKDERRQAVGTLCHTSVPSLGWGSRWKHAVDVERRHGEGEEEKKGEAGGEAEGTPKLR